MSDSVEEKEKVNIKHTVVNIFYHTSTATEPEPICNLAMLSLSISATAICAYCCLTPKKKKKNQTCSHIIAKKMHFSFHAVRETTAPSDI